MIVEQLSQVGIKANLKTPEWAIFNTDYKNGKYPIYLTGRGSLTDADTLFQQYFRTGMTRRVLGYSNPKLDEILEMEQRTFDVKKREKLLWEAHKSFWKMLRRCRCGMPWIFTPTAPIWFGPRRRMKRYR